MLWTLLKTPKMKRIQQSSLSFSILINLIIQNYVYHHGMAQTQISKSFFTPFSSDNNWKVYYALSSNHITDCRSSMIFGGLTIFNYETAITKTIILPPHYKLKFEFKFWRLNPWNGSVYTFYIDGFKAYKDNPNISSGTEICGSGILGDVYQISNVIDHNGNSAIVTLISLQISASWGISDLIISVYKCPGGCDFCDSTGNCQIWNRVLAYFTAIIFSDGYGWERDNFPYSGTQECGSFYFYGQFLMSEMISIDLNLPDPHTKYRIQFKFLCAFVTGSITIKVQANNVILTNTAFPINIITSSNIICGSYLKLDKIDLGEFLGSDSILTITIEISAFTTASASTPFYGIRDFKVFTDAEKKQVFDGVILCSDGNMYAFDGCFSSMYDCNKGCNYCIRVYALNVQILGYCIRFLDNVCLNVEIKLLCLKKSVTMETSNLKMDVMSVNFLALQIEFLVNLVNACFVFHNINQLIINVNLLAIMKKVKIQVSNHFNKKKDIIAKFRIFCLICISKMLQQINKLIFNTNKIPINTPQNCKVSFIDKCEICQEDFELMNNNFCIPKCGNGIIQEYEYCDDANILQFDGCYQCQISCQLECQQCNLSQCFQCIEEWNLIDFKCVSTCGDGKIALLQQEQCDDQNNEKNDGCFECKLECGQNCQFCNYNLDCVQCQMYFEIKNDICVPICGDGIVVEGFEQCDDGNHDQYDSCHDGQFSCKEECQICDRDKCLDNPQTFSCETGYYLIDNQCHSICGDLIIASNEQCDDANEIPFDGCYQCEFSCSQQCLDCIDGQCLKCDLDYQIKNNLCEDICGNGSKSKQEECDDNNQISQDGCSEKCEIEINWTCTKINFETSYCLQMKPPHFNLIYINQTYDSQFIQLQITSQVKLQDSGQNLTESLKFSLIDLNPKDYIIYDFQHYQNQIKNISFQQTVFKCQLLGFFLEFQSLEQKIYIFIYILTVVEPNDMALQYINYLFQIELLKLETQEIYFQVQFDAFLIDKYGFQVENQFCKLHLKNPIILSESQRIISHKISTLNMYILIGLFVSSFIILLSGNPGDCFEVLDTMQYQSNLKYLNSNFPENIIIYFESSQVVTIIPILEKLNILDLFYTVIGQEQIQAFGKFLSYDVNSDLITNLPGLILQIGITTVLLIASNSIYWSFIENIIINSGFSQAIIRIYFYYLNLPFSYINQLNQALLQIICCHSKALCVLFKQIVGTFSLRLYCISTLKKKII